MSETPTKHPVIDAAALLNTLDKEARDAGLATELQSFPDPAQIPPEVLGIASPNLGISTGPDSLGLMIGYFPGGAMTVLDLDNFFSGSVETAADSAGLAKVAETVRAWIKTNTPSK